MNTRVFRASFKRLLKCNPHCEPSYGTAEQNKAYVSKGDVLTKGDIINLPDELEGKVINEPVVFEKGEPAPDKKPGGSTESHKKSEQTKKINLEIELAKHKNAEQFVMMSPMIYGRFRNAIIDYYNAVLKAKPATKPYIEWHFGDTRSGKTFTCDILVGGRDCKDCHFQQGPFDWVTNYTGQEILYLNEYRASGKEAFTQLLSIMEGFPADIKKKGTFIPVRINKLFITCPRPPKALMCELFGQVVSFRGEYESQNRYSTDHESTAWEDVDQVVERIRESGGKLVAHARRPRENGTGYEYTSTVIFGNETELELPLKDAMSKLLSE